MVRPLPLPMSRLALFSRRLALFAVLIALIGIYVTRSHIVALAPSFAVLASAFGLASIAVVCAVGAFIVIWRTGARGLGSAYLGLTLSLFLLGYPAYLAALALILPPLTDISTDVSDAPIFSASDAVARKRDGYKPPPYRPGFAALQKTTYPDIQPIVVRTDVEETYRLVLEALQPFRWSIVASTPPQRTRDEAVIEAVEMSLVLRLPDDIVIRIRPYGQETRIDIRSVARIGAHDFGSNARRVTRLIDAVAESVREN